LEKNTRNQKGAKIKALGILKVFRDEQVFTSQKNYINEAIAELEAMQNRSCYSCEEYRDYTEDEKELYHEDGICLKSDGCAYKVYQDFCCNEYEPKGLENDTERI
jgi:hypothetical protein